MCNSHGVVGNTVSPAHDQVTALNNWTDAQLLRSYSLMEFTGFLCPSCLFVAMHHITKLRVASAAFDSPDATIPVDQLSTAASTAQVIRDFSPSQWTETYEILSQPLVAKYGHVYRDAVALYAILSLPQPLARVFSGANSIKEDNAARHHQRAVLLKHINDARGPLRRLKCGTWPLAVLGVAFHDGTRKEQDTVIRLLKEAHRITANADSGAGMLMRDLAAFWDSGKTGWEDCFHKPSLALT